MNISGSMVRETDTADPLSICADLFEEFHERGIQYCHWKSNEHLREGLTGATDLDILVNRTQDIEWILSRNGFKRFRTAWFVDYPAMSNYVGYDQESGELVHLHLHRRLAIGNKRLKDYHVPWEKAVLSRRIFDEEFDVYRADPEMELLLLLVRYALKIQARDYVKTFVGEYLDPNTVREYEWLLVRANNEEVVQLASELLGGEAATIVESMINAQPNFWQFRKLRSVCVDELSEYNTYGYFESKGRSILREGFLGLRSINERYFGRPRFYRRTVPSGGVSIVLLGVDGAGKSTLINKIDQWLSWKIDVQRIYYGSGDGPATILRYPLIAVQKWIDGNETGNTVGSESERSIVMRFGRALRGLVLARERRKKLRTGWRAKNRGLVVLGDRYPQNQIMDFNDGPLLHHLSSKSSRWLRYLSHVEEDVYESAQRNPPDLVIKLDVSPKEAHDRKPEMPIEQIRRRKVAIKSIEFDTEVMTIDAEQPMDDVLREVKSAVWERL